MGELQDRVMGRVRVCGADEKPIINPQVPQLAPVLAELVKLLPPPDTPFSLEERRLWLRAFAACADVIYGEVKMIIK